MDGLSIRNLICREANGRSFYTADVVNGDQVVPVSRRYGSWLTADGLHDLRPAVAAMLQRAVGKIERSEARA
jgi:hypothetical protein